MADEPSNELKFEVTLSESRDNVTLRFGAPATLNAGGIEGLIAAIAHVRSQMSPEISPDPVMQGQVAACIDPRYSIGVDPMRGGVMLGLRHPGLGWLYFQIPHQGTARLRELLAEHSHPAQTPGAAH